MGTTQAMGMRDAMDDGDISEEMALRWHLTANIYPPVPAERLDDIVEHAQAALEAAREGEWDAIMPLEGDRCVIVAQVIEYLHLEAFL